MADAILKRCTLCGEMKSTSSFSPRKANKDGLYSWCKPCSSSRMREWSAKNKERVSQRNKAVYWSDPEAARAKRTAYYRAKTGGGPRKPAQVPLEDERGCQTLLCAGCNDRKPLSGFYVRKDGRYRIDCKDCCAARSSAYVAENKEQVSEYKKRWRAENLTRLKEAKRARYRKNAADAKQKVAAYRIKHPERVKSYKAKWKQSNRHKTREYRFVRGQAQRQATPAWADREAMVAIYRTAREVTKITGAEHHVDHIVPVRSRVVCGLHCEQNMQILDAKANISKNNRHWPDMWV
jgi:hypothetical protein